MEQHSNRSLAGALLAALSLLIAVVAVVAEVGPSQARPPAVSIKLTGPTAVAPGAELEIQVRAKRGMRGKAVLQRKVGSQWRTWRSQKLPRDREVLFEVAAPGGGGAIPIRARVGRQTSRTLTLSVRPAAPTPSPSPTESPLPELPPPPPPSDEDPRCKAQFGSGTRVLEQEHRVRPLGWPQTPPWAVLCRLVHVTGNEEYGCYATDPGTKFYDILWYYDHAIEAGQADYVTLSDGSVLLTGVVGDSSFWIEQDVFDQYFIVWARDGQYEEEITFNC